MSRIAQLQKDIQEAIAAIARAERAAGQYPEYPSSLVTLRSIQKRKEMLEEEFREEVALIGRDICSYRIEYDQDKSPTITGLTSALRIFQDMFTNTYHSIVNGPKKRATVSNDSIEATTLEFSYAFSGSIGFMMTLKNDTDLLGESQVTKAMDLTMQLISASEVNKINELTQVVGLPALRLAHRWAIENAKAGFGADIMWKADEHFTLRKRVQAAAVSDLAITLAHMIAKERVRVLGDLLNVSMTEKTFQMQVEGKTIAGTFDKAISESKPAQLPGRYYAQLVVSTPVAAIENDESATFFLDKLEPYQSSIVGSFPPP